MAEVETLDLYLTSVLHKVIYILDVNLKYQGDKYT